MLLLKKIKNLVFNNTNNNKERSGIIIGERSKIDISCIEIRNQQINQIYFDCGKDSIIKGQFVCETKNSKIIIGDRSFIGGGLFISASEIYIGNDVMFSWGCTVMDNDAHSLIWEERKHDVLDWKKGVDENKIGYYKNWDKVEMNRIIINDKVWIGFNVIILKGVTIGEGAVVAAGSVVTKDVEPYSLYAGNPARFIKKLI